MEIEDLSLKICRSAHFRSTEIANKTYRLPSLFTELRFDLSTFPLDNLSDLTLPEKFIFTCRKGRFTETERLKAYKKALEIGADFIDLDFETDLNLLDHLKSEIAVCKTQLILSQHNYNSTPNFNQLKESTQKAFDLGADIAKIITTAKKADDLDRIYQLYQHFDNLIAFAMGEEGMESRAKILFLGAPFTYAAFSEKEITAPGQMNFQQTANLYHQLNSIRK